MANPLSNVARMENTLRTSRCAASAQRMRAGAPRARGGSSRRSDCLPGRACSMWSIRPLRSARWGRGTVGRPRGKAGCSILVWPRSEDWTHAFVVMLCKSCDPVSVCVATADAIAVRSVCGLMRTVLLQSVSISADLTAGRAAS